MSKKISILAPYYLRKNLQTKSKKEEELNTKLLLDNGPIKSKDYAEEAKILKCQIKNENSKNIALVSQYGAGKSSAIKTYLKRYRYSKLRALINFLTFGKLCRKYKNCERISLATFNEVDYTEDEIEQSILQQLLYTRKGYQLPNSKIERTNRTSWIWTFFKCLLATLFVFTTLFTGLILGGVNIFGENSWALRYWFIGSSVGTFFCILAYLLHRHKIVRIKYKDLEADINNYKDENKVKNKNGKSLINKFLDEILYYFECTKTNLVIFEDLDRLPKSGQDIFVKLRELNTIINNANTKSRKVTFLYAIKDDLFKDEIERAKFFEFILPIIPVVNPINTADKLREHNLKLFKKNPNLSLDDKFLKNISAYIPDMRIFKNVFNDYTIMWHKLCVTNDKKVEQNKIENSPRKNKSLKLPKGLNNNALFSLMLYKSLFPYDYALLTKNSGLIPLIFNREKLMAHKIADIDQEIANINAKIEEIKNEKLVCIDDLKLMLRGMLQKQNYSYIQNPDNDCINIDNIKTFKDLTPDKIKHPSYLNYSQYGYRLPNNEFPLTPNGKTFYEREQVICNSDENISKLNGKIAELQKQKNTLKKSTCIDLIHFIGVNNFFSAENKEKLEDEYFNVLFFEGEEKDEEGVRRFNRHIQYLKFLIYNKYIQDNVIEYTSNYSTVLISSNDREFVKSIKNGESNFEKKFDDIMAVIKQLDKEDFSNVCVLNKEILSNLPLVKKDDTAKYDNLLELLSIEDSDVINCITNYIQVSSDDEITDLIKALSRDKRIFYKLYIQTKIDEMKLYIVLATIIRNSIDIKEYNIDNCITIFLSKCQNYMLLFEKITTEQAISLIQELKPIFGVIQPLQTKNNDKAKAIYNEIVKTNSYVIDTGNLATILNVTKDNKQVFLADNYEFIKNSNQKKLIDYINKNLNAYCINVLLRKEVGVKKTHLDDVKALLKNNSIPYYTRQELCIKYRVKFDTVDGFNESEIADMLNRNLLTATLTNIVNAKEIINDETYSVRDFIIKNNREFSANTNIEITDLLLEIWNSIFTPECKQDEIQAIKKIVETIKHDFELNSTYNDLAMSIYIENGNHNYDVNDFSCIMDKPKSLIKYLQRFSTQIKNELIEFFGEDINPQILANIILYSGVDLNLRKDIFITYENKIELLNQAEKYYRFIVDNCINIKPDTVWKFTQYDFADKGIDLLELCLDNLNISGNTPQKIKEYLISLGDIFPKIYEKEIKINVDNKVDNLIYKLNEKGLVAFYGRKSSGLRKVKMKDM